MTTPRSWDRKDPSFSNRRWIAARRAVSSRCGVVHHPRTSKPSPRRCCINSVIKLRAAASHSSSAYAPKVMRFLSTAGPMPDAFASYHRDRCELTAHRKCDLDTPEHDTRRDTAAAPAAPPPAITHKAPMLRAGQADLTDLSAHTEKALRAAPRRTTTPLRSWVYLL